ncbi:MAG: hypothetical protein F6K48_22175, partial [Okeania sp. SIO3H1]|nr:hypothetical protein [Okeania sp. SIO3H1]
MVNYKTPNVYIEEISTLPPSVAGVATGIPAFIGYTAKVIQDDGEDLTNVPTRITSIFEYETLFGNAEPAKFEIQETADGISISNMADVVKVKYLMYYALQMFFNNGGGPCYIVSVGTYSETGEDKQKTAFETGLAALQKEDEPTLILLSDAANLPLDGNSKPTDYYDLCQKALAQCNTLQDRFAVFDVVQKDDDDVDDFRSGIGQEYLKYGAVYYPYLQTSLNYYYTDDSVTVEAFNYQEFAYKTAENGLIVGYTGAKSDEAKVNVVVDTTIEGDVAFDFGGSNEEILVIKLKTDSTAASVIATEWGQVTDKKSFEVKVDGDGSETVGEASTPTELDTLEYLRSKEIQGGNGITVDHVGGENDEPKVNIILNEQEAVEFEFTESDKTLIIKLKEVGLTTVQDIITAWSSVEQKNNFAIKENGVTSTEITASGEVTLDTLEYLRSKEIAGDEGITVTHTGVEGDVPKVNIIPNDEDTVDFEFSADNKTLIIK